MSELRRSLKGASALVFSAILVGAVSQPAAAQDPMADEWLPWLGCWQALDAPADAPLTCVRPAPGGGILMLTVSEEGIVERRHLVADGVPRHSTVGGCPGTEQAEFSHDGARVYLEAERTCPGDAPRASRGLIAMLDQDRWIEAQAMEVRGRTTAWMQRYEPAPRARVQALGQAEILAEVDSRRGVIAAARAVAADPISVDDIIEAYQRTDAEAVRVWIAEQLQPLYLDAQGLLRLADAGVSEEVIDVAVAVAYPERFAVARDEPYYPRARMPVRRPGMYPGYWDPYGGWGYWGRGWGYYRPTVVVVQPRSRFDRLTAVRGQGYTRPGASSGSSGSQPSGAAARAPRRGGSSQPAATSGSGTRTAEPRRAQPRNRNQDD